MSASLFRAYRASGALAAVSSCAPSNGTYLAYASNGTDGVVLARVDETKTITWQKLVTVSSGVGASSSAGPVLSSSSDGAYCALAVTNLPDGIGPWETTISLFSSSGSLSWQVSHETQIQHLAVTTAGVVYAFGLNTAGESTALKLNASTGATTWEVRLNDTTFTTTSYIVTDAKATAAGDAIFALNGPQKLPTITYGTSRGMVQKLNASDGSIAWSTRLLWSDTSNNKMSLAEAPSGDIYVAGQMFLVSSKQARPVVKLSSAGAVTWVRAVQHPTGATSRTLSGSGCMATDAGPFFTTDLATNGGSVMSAGHAFMDASGTTGTGLASLSLYDLQRTGGGSAVGATAFSQAAFTAYDNVGGSDFSVVANSDALASNDQSFGPYVRTTYSYDVATGGTSLTEPYTYSRAASPSTAAGTGSVSIATSTDLQVEVYTGGVELPWSPTTAFGSATATSSLVFGVATSLGVVTNFGSPSGGFRVYATGSLFDQTFGTPTYSPNAASSASSLAPSTTFGLAWAELGSKPITPGTVYPQAPSTAFGMPSAGAVAYPAASGFLATLFGTPSVGQVAAATGFMPTLFGTPALRTTAQAAGYYGSAFGTPTVSVVTYTAAINSTRFGAPTARSLGGYAAAGWQATNIGTPSALTAHVRARSAYFRTKWGSASSERSA